MPRGDDNIRDRVFTVRHRSLSVGTWRGRVDTVLREKRRRSRIVFCQSERQRLVAGRGVPRAGTGGLSQPDPVGIAIHGVGFEPGSIQECLQRISRLEYSFDRRRHFSFGELGLHGDLQARLPCEFPQSAGERLGRSFMCNGFANAGTAVHRTSMTAQWRSLSRQNFANDIRTPSW